MKWRKVTAMGLTVVMAVSIALTGCGKSGGTSGNSPGGDTKKTEATDQSAGGSGPNSNDSGTNGELLTLEVYDVAANYQGMQSGWFGKLVKDKFNIELNIFAPNTSGDAEALYQTRCSSGKLGDIILLDNDKFVDCINAGLIKDVTDTIWNYANLSNFNEQISALNNQMGDEGKIYGIPTEMTNTTPDKYSESDPFSAPCLPWDYYKELGCPDIKNLDELLDVLEQMQKAHPTNADGDAAYAISLWKDWDGFGMENICQTAKWYGQEAKHSVLIGNDNTMMSLIDENGAYYKMLKFFYKANQRGLIDPDSSIQDWTTADQSKIRTYRTYLLWYNWAMKLSSIGLTEEDRAAGKGFVNIPVADLNCYQVADSYYGTGRVWGVGSQVDEETEKRIMSFLDWLASPEASTYMWVGIEGLTYTVDENGRYIQTEDASDYVGGNKEVPEEWGGGGFADGQCKLNQYIVSSMSINPENNEPYSLAYWSSNLEKPKEKRYSEWSEKYGADIQTEYYEKNGLMTIVPNVNMILESDTTDIALIRSQCGQEITNASWKMIYAANDAEFDQMWSSLKETLVGLGWDELLAFDMAKYQKVIDARIEAMK